MYALKKCFDIVVFGEVHVEVPVVHDDALQPLLDHLQPPHCWTTCGQGLKKYGQPCDRTIRFLGGSESGKLLSEFRRTR